MVKEEKGIDEEEYDGKLLKKKKKKEKKEKKKSKKKEKKDKKDKIREEELKKIFENYGLYNIKEKGPNIVYLEEKKKDKIENEESF